MEIDIKGKINEKKLAYSNTLLPLYEAVVNSIHAIDEYSSTKPGIIEIDIARSNQKELDFENIDKLPEIIDFVIKDNGIGFNERNFESFNYAHSTYKKGGKGIGRFTWLRAFHKAEIESYYTEGEKSYFRKFSFEPTKKGIENYDKKEVVPIQKHSTIVKLINLKEDYRKWCNSKTEDIALKIIEHTFIYFLNKDCPRIKINDFGETVIVNDLFSLFTKGQVDNKNVTIRNNKFKLSIVKLFNNKIDNKIHYCANNREVLCDKISVDIPEFDNFLTDDEDRNYSIAVYVEGDFLDNNVNEERTNIAFSKGEIEYPMRPHKRN
ncbi:MAG: ATP-binding protein [Bacteroidales bacterium]|nr:ATP-binding protein [Bacteroidales bacterium]